MVLVAKSQKNIKRKAQITTLIVIAAILLVTAVTVIIAFGYYVDSLDTVFPNVWADDIDVSGLSLERAKQALIDGGYENRADNIAATVYLPYDLSFTVTGNEVGLRLNAQEAAEAAYAYGREGSFLGNALTYLRTLSGETHLTELSLPNYDATPIRELSQEYAKLFNDSLYDNNLEISDNQITVIKGTGYASVTSDEIFNFAELVMRRAIDGNKHMEDRFIPEKNEDDSIDLQPIYDYIFVEPVSSRYDPDLGNPNSENYDSENLGATESVVGQSFDLEAAEELIRSTPNGETVIIPIIKTEPELSQTQLREMLFRDVLGERQASQGSDANRATNIRLASAAIDGLVLQPGEVFSYNQVVGQRTQARGYREANAISYGVLTPELGGGVCQVSSALYAALIETDLEIVSRLAHGLRVAYLPGGQDATVSWGSIDFKFKNNSDYPIRLEITTTGSVTVDVKIYGTRVNEVYYKIVSERIDNPPMDMTTIEREVTPEDNLDLSPGEQHILVQGNNGSKWEVWRHHYADPDFTEPILNSNGQQVKELYNTTTYPMRQRVIVFRPYGNDHQEPPQEPPQEP